MGKQRKSSGYRGKRTRNPESGSGRRKFLLASTGIVVAGIAAGLWAYRFKKASNPEGREKPFVPVNLNALPRRETRGTLPPALFTGSVATAYAVARRIPALLDQLDSTVIIPPPWNGRVDRKGNLILQRKG